jgi:hypothetical protein
MRRALWALVVVFFLPVPAARAADYAGRLGVGYFSTDAPIGFRYWLGSRLGLDLGVGFYSRDVLDLSTADATDETVFTDFNLDVGLPLNLIMRTRTNLFFRPGLLYSKRPQFYGSETLKTRGNETSMDMNATLGVEFWLWDHLSLTVGTGVSYVLTNHPEPNVDSSFVFTHRALTLSNVGFHFYL